MIPGFADLNYYELLNITPGVDFKEIQAGYYRVRSAFSKNALASYSLYTPEEREKILRLVEEAYHTLIDEKAREQYERQLFEERTKMLREGKVVPSLFPFMADRGETEARPELEREAEEEPDRELIEEKPYPDTEETMSLEEAEEEKELAEPPPRPDQAPSRPRDYRDEANKPAEDEKESGEMAAAAEKETEAKPEKPREKSKPLFPQVVSRETPPLPKPYPARLADKKTIAEEREEASRRKADADTAPSPTSTKPGPLPPRERPSPTAPPPAPVSPELEKDGEDTEVDEEYPEPGQVPETLPAKEKPGFPISAPRIETRPYLKRPPETGRSRTAADRPKPPVPLSITPKAPTAKVPRPGPEPSPRGREPFEDTVFNIPPPKKPPTTPLDYLESTVSGQYLKQERENRGITLDQVWEVTRIRRPILIAIEEEQYKKLPADVFLKGMILIYSRFLDLDDPESVVKGYMNRLIATRDWLE